MANQVNPATQAYDARETFARKLEAFAKPLSKEESLMFKEILARGGMSPDELQVQRAGKIMERSIVARSSKLDRGFFTKLLDW